MTSSEKSEWERVFALGAAAQQAGNHLAASEQFRLALKLDGHHAETLFRLAQCELSLNHSAEAARLFAQARDEDALRFRADSRLNQIIRATGTNHSARGVRVLDVEDLLARVSADRITGAEFFYEHVHFNFTGNYLVARALAEQAAETPALRARGTGGRWLTQMECAQRLAWTDWNRLETAELLHKRTARPPFTQQFDHAAQEAAANRELQQLRTRQTPEAFRSMQSVYQRAVDAAPQDWVLHENFARLLRRRNDFSNAVHQAEQVVPLLPHRADRWCQLGLALQEAGRADEAARAFGQAQALDDREARAPYGLGVAKLRQSQFADAVTLLNRSLKLDAASADARAALGQALLGLGRTNEALVEFQRVLKSEPAHAQARAGLKKLTYGEALPQQLAELIKLAGERPNDAALQSLLGEALVADGQLAEAKKHFAAAVELDPTDASAHFFLAQEFARENQNDQAIAHFAKAAELQPADAQAHFNLGVALARARRFSEALEQFDATLRLDPENQQARQYANAVRAQLKR